ncbi:MAG TPA: transporter [Phycisphaerae bacterium]|nr:transporter [Phycisphaerae bacterium]
MRILSLAPSLALLAAISTNLHAQESQPAPAPDKSQYNLFNPTPASAMRDFSSDRPDQTEGPITVDAGHLQLELSLADYVYDRHKASTDKNVSTTLAAAPFNIRLGLTNDVELDVMDTPYFWNRDRNRDTGDVDHQDGTGDTTLRIKWNLIGNDDGHFALALLPFIKLPTNTIEGYNHNVEGGLIIPFQFDLPLDFHAGAMTEFDALRDDDRDEYHSEFVNSATLHHLLIGKLDSYVEFYSVVSSKGAGNWIGTADTGLLYPITDNIQIDCGANFGVTKSAPDLEVFTGLSIRF